MGAEELEPEEPGPEVELTGPSYAEAPPYDPLKALEGLDDSPDLDDVAALLRRLGEVAEEQEDRVGVEVLRERAVNALQGKVNSPGRMVDAAVRGSWKPSAPTGQGQVMGLEPPDPWPKPVDGEALLAGLTLAFSRFVALPDGAAAALALWVMHAHAHAAAAVSPLLALTSPEKRCGKTTTLTVLGALVPKPLPASNITPAALFRAVEHFSPTLLVDEADTFLYGEREELRGVLNSGHTRALAYVVRTVGDDHEPRKFSTWAPKALALIGKLPSTLEDRSILVPLRRKTSQEEVERLRLDRLGVLEELPRKAARWASDHLKPLSEADPEPPKGLHDRAADNWRPLLAIADAVGGAWPEKARHTALLLSAPGGIQDSSARIELLADLREIFQTRNVDRLFSETLLEDLHSREDRRWGEWKRGKPLSTHALARLLRPFGVTPQKLRIGDRVRQGYHLKTLEDAFIRYLPAPGPEHPEQTNDDAGLRGSPNRNNGADVPLWESPQTPIKTGNVSGVPVRDRGAGK